MGMKRIPKRLLLVVAESPWSRSSGGQQRVALLHGALSDVAPVDVLILQEAQANEALAGDRPEILARLRWKQPPFTVYKFGVHRWVNAWCHANIDLAQYDVVVGRDITPISKIDWPRHMRKMLDCDDIYYRYTPERSTVLAWGAAAGKTCLRFGQAKIALGQFDHLFFCSPRDQTLFASRSSSILPNVVACRQEYRALPDCHEPAALIVGSMSYSPNRQGVEWFLERCWPAVAERCPSLKLRIVGAVPSPVQERWSRVPRTEVPGFVADLADEYARALFAIAPVMYGGGSCIKFLEAGAFGKACVVTRHVWKPFCEDFREGESVLVGRNAGGMIAACTALFGNSEYRAAVAQRSREIVARLYTPERFRSAVISAVRKIMQETPATIPALKHQERQRSV